MSMLNRKSNTLVTSLVAIVAISAKAGGNMPEIKTHIDSDVRAVIDLYEGILSESLYTLPIRRQLEIQAECLSEAHRNGNPAVHFQISSWHPKLVGQPTVF